MKKYKLNPCPFCGGNAKIAELGDDFAFEVYCIGCGARQSEADTVKEAANRWNRRVIEGVGMKAQEIQKELNRINDARATCYVFEQKTPVLDAVASAYANILNFLEDGDED